MGKSVLLDYLSDRVAGWHVARAVGVESEMELAFSGLHQLCAPMLDHLERLPAPQRDALATVFGLTVGAAPDRFLVGLATLTLFAELAEKQPLVCVVDDAQWLDQASAQVLAFVGRRLLAERVALVCAARTGIGDDVLAGLPQLLIRGLGDSDARGLLLDHMHGTLQHPLEAARQRPEPTSRCAIPHWFEPLRAGLRRDLYDAEHALMASEARRARLATEATAAERDLVGIEAATAPARQALAAATSHYEEAGRRHARAHHHLDHSGIRGRRNARRDHDAAVGQLEAATEHLERTRRHTAADVEHYHQARTRADETGTALHRHDMRQRLNHTVDHIAALRRQVESLDLWGRWAGGDTVNVQRLVDVVGQLTSVSRRDEHADQFRTLGETVRDWADDAGIDLHTPERHSRNLQRAGPELGL